MFCTIFSRVESNENSVGIQWFFFSLLLQSRNIDNEFDFQQLAYFKTRIGVSNSFQVCWGCYSVSSVARCTFSPSLNGMAHCLTKVCSIKGANYLRLTAPVDSQLSCCVHHAVTDRSLVPGQSHPEMYGNNSRHHGIADTSRGPKLKFLLSVFCYDGQLRRI